MTPQDRIKAIRKERGLTTAELGKLMGKPQSTISKLENGKVRMTSDIIMKLSQALNVSVEVFFEEEGNLCLVHNHTEINKNNEVQKDCFEKECISNNKDLKEDKYRVEDDKPLQDMDIPEDRDITEEFTSIMSKIFSSKDKLYLYEKPLDEESLSIFEGALRCAFSCYKRRLNLEKNNQG